MAESTLSDIAFPMAARNRTAPGELLPGSRQIHKDTHQAHVLIGGRAYSCLLYTSYRFPEPIIHLTRDYEDQVMGLQFSLWTERVADAKRLDYMTRCV